jgi:subtilase family serine protease
MFRNEPTSCQIDLDNAKRMGMVALAVVLFTAAAAGDSTGRVVIHNTPPYVATAKNLGPEDPSKIIDVSIWLNLHNRDGMDALARDLYDRSSPSYRRWLTPAQIAARFAPTANEAKTVEEFFESHNLRVVKVAENNLFVRARGTVGDVEQAFHVQLNNYSVGKKAIRANAQDPDVEGAAGPLVRTVSGLDSGEYEHPLVDNPIKRVAENSNPNGNDLANFDAMNGKGMADPDFYSSNCFEGPVTQQFSTNNDGQLPIGVYTGNLLNLQSMKSPGCGYTPSPIYTAYNLSGLYEEGFTGAGQTIVIVDWCGSSTIQDDANAFSKKFGLPLLKSSNFQIIYTPTESSCIGADMVEINLDVEWAHAIAPGANIDLVVPPSAAFQDVDEAEFYAVNALLGNSLSGSYGSKESATPASVLDTENLISEMAALSGISTNFSSGDDGDYSTSGSVSVNAPADSPWATGVGGVSLALNSDNSIAWQSGWGTYESLLAQYGVISDPPAPQGFYFGSGGGPSSCAVQDQNGNCLGGFPKPTFQKGVPGKFRQVPDIAWLADPLTGAVIAISIPGEQPELQWQVIGGTSLACPMFSALWAIANQEAAAPLGQAAQYVYSLPRGAITDVVPVTSEHNVTASIQEPNATHRYNPAEVIGGVPPAALGKFVSALWDEGTGYNVALAVSFGTDCSMSADDYGTLCNEKSALHTKIGWDNVTGVGTPNGQAFADAFNAAKDGSK